jgi:hypothetical protein
MTLPVPTRQIRCFDGIICLLRRFEFAAPSHREFARSTMNRLRDSTSTIAKTARNPKNSLLFSLFSGH